MEIVVTRCRLCGKPMNVPRMIMMVFTFDPSVCNQCRERVPKGMWDTSDNDEDTPKETCRERAKRLRSEGYEGTL